MDTQQPQARQITEARRGRDGISHFEWVYMFVMVIYMGVMTNATRTLFSISPKDNLIGILIPNVLTIVLVVRHTHKLRRNRMLWVLLSLVTIWIIGILAKFGMVEARSGLYTIYYIIIAYIQTQIFGRALFPMFERIMVVMCKIAVVMWVAGSLVPMVAGIYNLFPLATEDINRSMTSNNVLFIYNWVNDSSRLFPRNSGFALEPGRFAIMVCLAMTFNLLKNGIKFRGNRPMLWYMAALGSTMSTTGYSIMLVMYVYFAIKRLNVKYVFVAILIFVPTVYAVSKLDFMTEKIQEQYEDVSDVRKMVNELAYNKKHDKTYRMAMARFTSIYFESLNIQNDPFLGYGPTTNNSYFTRNIATNASLTGGILKIPGKFGVPLALVFYILLFRSSQAIARSLGSRKGAAVFICVFMSLISYNVFDVALYSTFWFYGAFAKSPKLTLKKGKRQYLAHKIR